MKEDRGQGSNRNRRKRKGHERKDTIGRGLNRKGRLARQETAQSSSHRLANETRLAERLKPPSPRVTAL